MTAALGKELEIRECFVPSLKSAGTVHSHSENISSGSGSQGETANALLVDTKKRCVFYWREHLPEQCEHVTDIEERKGILRKYARIFACLNSNHRVFECKTKGVCKICKGKRHHSICNNNKPKLSFNATGLEGQHKSNIPLNVNVPTWVGNTGSRASVSLPTVLAKVEGEKCESRVWVLFDTVSYINFIC